MADRKLELILAVRADGTIAIDRVVGQLDRVGKEADEAGKSTQSLEKALGRLDRGTEIAGNLAKQFLVAGAAAGALAVAVVGMGVKHNAQLQQSKLAIAALVSSMGGVSDFNDALIISEGLVRKLQVAALQTKAEFGDLVRVMQEGMGPAIQAGFDEDQIVKFIQMIAQTGGALGIAGDRLGQEIRALLAGERGPDNQIANALFGDEKDVKAKIAALRESGELFDWLEAKMKAFAKAGESAADTFDGALSNLKDAITQALGEATQGATSDFTTALKDLTAEIVTFDEAGNAVFDESFVAGVRALADGLVYLGNAGVGLVKSLPDVALQLEAMKRAVTDHPLLTAGLVTSPFLAPVATPFLAESMVGNIRDARNDILVERQTEAMEEAAKRQENLIMKMRLLREELASITGTMPTMSLDVTAMFFDPKSGASPEIRMKALTQAAKDGAVTLKEYEAALKALTPHLGKTPAAKGGGATDALKKQIEDYKAWVEEAKAAASAAGDPLAEALAKIESDRIAAIAKIEAANKKLPGALALSDVATDAQNQIFDQKAIDAIVKAWEAGLKEKAKAIEEADKAAIESAEATAEILTEIQRAGEDDRIAAIEDSVERELQMRLAANEQWYAEMKATVAKEIATEEEKAAVLAALGKEKSRRNKLAADEAERLRKQDIAGTEEWARKVRKIIDENLGTIAEDMATVIEGSTGALRGAFNDLFEGLTEGRFEIVDTLRGLGKQIGSIWGQMFANMLTRAIQGKESLMSQLKGMWDAVGQAKGVDVALAGAGIGSMIGGLGAAILGPGNYAAEGGTIGGALGAAIGAYFGAPQIGAIIGAAIGTAIGGAIGKDEDWIKVAIKDGILSVTEDGLSAEGRMQLQRELERAVRNQVKGWNSILELFPAELQEQLAGLVTPLDITGGVEGGDIEDAGALQALSDWINDTLNRSLYIDYIPAIRAGLEAMGVSDVRISQMFREWGSLQGEEILAAVRAYIEALVETVRVRDLFKPGEGSTTMVDDARNELVAQTPILRVRSMVDELGMLISNLPKLDPTDQIAAMEQVNALGQRIWDNMIAQLQRIDAIQESIKNSLQGTREQILLAGMDDDQKVDFYFERLRDLREQLMQATNPEQIMQLSQQMNGYIQQLLGQADTPEERQQLLNLLDQIDAITGEQLDEARDLVVEEQLRAFALLERAAQALLDAVSSLPTGPVVEPPPPPPPPPPPGTVPGPRDPRDPFNLLGEAATGSASVLDAFARSVRSATNAVRGGLPESISLTPPGGGGAASSRFIPSHASGLDYVPYDGYIARLHQGERVVSARDARGQEAAREPVRVEVYVTGPGTDFLQQVGAEVTTQVVGMLRRTPWITARNYD